MEHQSKRALRSVRGTCEEAQVCMRGLQQARESRAFAQRPLGEANQSLTAHRHTHATVTSLQISSVDLQRLHRKHGHPHATPTGNTPRPPLPRESAPRATDKCSRARTCLSTSAHAWSSMEGQISLPSAVFIHIEWCT
eukprot:6213365-Pleurochrysis_carterae.AAC.8